MTEEEWDAVIDVHLKGHFAPIALRRRVLARRRARTTGEPVERHDREHRVRVGPVRQRRPGQLRRGQGRHRVDDDRDRARARARSACASTRSRRSPAPASPRTSGGAASEGRRIRSLDPTNVAAGGGWLASDLSDGVTGQVVKVQGGVVPDRAGLAADHRGHERQAVDDRVDRRAPRRAVREARTRASRRSSSHRRPTRLIPRCSLAWGDEETRSAPSCVAFLDEHAPPEAARGLRLRRRRREERDDETHPAVGARLAGDAVRPRLDDPGLPARARRPERHAGADARVPRGDGDAPHPALAALPRVRDRRAEPARVRQRRAAGARARRDPRRHHLVHRHERAERRLRPRRAPDARRARRRPLRRQRPEGVDELRDDRRRSASATCAPTPTCRSTRASAC